MSPSEWLSLGREFGIFAVMVIYFVIQTSRREYRLSIRLTTLETFVETKLVGLVSDTTVALQHSALALETSTHAISILTEHVLKASSQMATLTSELRYRPCLLDSEKFDKLDVKKKK